MSESADFSFRRRHVGRALARAFWLFEAQIDAKIRARFPDYRASDGEVIRCLPVDQGARIVELAERAKISKQGMGKLIQSLEERGYVEREADPSDGRAQRVRLTKRGRQLLQVAGAAMVELEAEWSEVVGKARLDQLRETLLSLADALGPSDYL